MERLKNVYNLFCGKKRTRPRVEIISISKDFFENKIYKAKIKPKYFYENFNKNNFPILKKNKKFNNNFKFLVNPESFMNPKIILKNKNFQETFFSDCNQDLQNKNNLILIKNKENISSSKFFSLNNSEENKTYINNISKIEKNNELFNSGRTDYNQIFQSSKKLFKENLEKNSSIKQYPLTKDIVVLSDIENFSYKKNPENKIQNNIHIEIHQVQKGKAEINSENKKQENIISLLDSEEEEQNEIDIKNNIKKKENNENNIYDIEENEIKSLYSKVKTKIFEKKINKQINLLSDSEENENYDEENKINFYTSDENQEINLSNNKILKISKELIKNFNKFCDLVKEKDNKLNYPAIQIENFILIEK